MRSIALLTRAIVVVATALQPGCAKDGSLRVTVLQGSEPGSPAPAAVVTVGGVSATTDADGVAVVKKIPAGSHLVQIDFGGSCKASRTVVIKPRKRPSLVIWCTDQVATPSAPTSKLIALVDIRSPASDCLNDWPVQGTNGVAPIGKNALLLDTPAPSCPAGAWVLTPDRAPAFSNNPADFPWKNGLGDVYDASLPVRRLRVPVTVWISAEGLTAKDRQDLRDELKDAVLPKSNDLLRASFAGLRLTKGEASDELPEIIDVADLSDGTGNPPYHKIGSGCESVGSITATPLIYRSEQINVYYVEEITGGTPKGYNCVEVGAPNIIFMHAKENDYWSLLHEIGHGLSLSKPDWGHTDIVPGFRRDATGGLNVMSVYVDIPTYFSAGQIVRMHASADSWLNLTRSDGSSVRSRQLSITPFVTPCGCRLKEESADCPRQRADVVRPGIENPEVGDFLTCHVRTKSCVDVPAGGTVTFEAQFFTDETASTSGSLDARVINLTPSIINASGDASSTPFTVKVEGLSNGPGQLRVLNGGAFALVDVRVGGACP